MSLVLFKMFENIVLLSLDVDRIIEVEFYVSWNLVSSSYLQFQTLHNNPRRMGDEGVVLNQNV